MYDLEDEFHGDYVVKKAKERLEMLCKYNECKEVNDKLGMAEQDKRMNEQIYEIGDKKNLHITYGVWNSYIDVMMIKRKQAGLIK